MIHPGLVSITFRKLSPVEIVGLVRKAGLRGIEWGGDVHAPHGDIGRAREVRALTEDAGLKVAAYGSYYRAGWSEANGLSFKHVLDSAVELGAPTIRVWPGNKGSAEMRGAGGASGGERVDGVSRQHADGHERVGRTDAGGGRACEPVHLLAASQRRGDG
ncbi:MAG: sugar phosphate isomerase/epimerase [Opitutaceae bacterium]|nr:sugar phosphate isomerase/epimerase [Opitutaceae bacterium]